MIQGDLATHNNRENERGDARDQAFEWISEATHCSGSACAFAGDSLFNFHDDPKSDAVASVIRFILFGIVGGPPG